MDGGAWWAAVHGVARSRIWLSDFSFAFHSHALEKEMATHCSVLAWRIPGTGEPGGLPSMGSHRVGHDWSDLAAAAPAPCHKETLAFISCISKNFLKADTLSSRRFIFRSLVHRTISGLREEMGVDLGNTSQMSLLPFRNALGTSLILPKISLSFLKKICVQY